MSTTHLFSKLIMRTIILNVDNVANIVIHPHGLVESYKPFNTHTDDIMNNSVNWMEEVYSTYMNDEECDMNDWVY